MDKRNTTAITGKEAFYGLFVALLCHHAHILIYAKTKAWNENLQGDEPATTPDVFRMAMLNCFRNGYAWQTFKAMTSTEPTRLAYDSQMGPLKLTTNLAPSYFDFSTEVQGEVTIDRMLCNRFHLKSVPIPHSEYLLTLYPAPEKPSGTQDSEDSEDNENDTRDSSSSSEMDTESSSPSPSPTPSQLNLRQKPKKRVHSPPNYGAKRRQL
ncbi:hypothetical protein H0H92_002450 [Tricholoma furcatifolium]|nr:hypothetical protein H0H92_002450 [Tricholoma furcatifolium]